MNALLLLVSLSVSTPAAEPLREQLAGIARDARSTARESRDYIRRNRGNAIQLHNWLRSNRLTIAEKQGIQAHYSELLRHKSDLLKTARRLDRESGELYRRKLKMDVLGLMVQLISQGRHRFHFSSTDFFEYYFSRAEGRPRAFRVTLPPAFSARQSYPLMVMVAGSVVPSKKYPFIRVRPTGYGVWGFRSMSRYDVMKVIDHTRRRYHIDETRIYLTGYSAGATGVMHTAALRQQTFAAVVPFVAFGNDLPLENFLNLPLRCEHGARDWTSSIGNVRVQFQKLKKLGYDAVLHEHPNAGHGIAMPAATMSWLFQQRRVARPKHIRYVCEHPRDGRIYWLRIKRFKDPHQVARLEAKLSDQVRLSIDTKNVTEVWVDLDRDVVRRGKNLLTIDKQQVEFTRAAGQRWLVLHKRNGRWETDPMEKPTRTTVTYGAGAAANLFQGQPLLIIYGTGGDDKCRQFLRRVASSLSRCAGPTWRPASVAFPVVADRQVDQRQLPYCNLLIVGTPENNKYLSRIQDRLPYQIKSGKLIAGKRRPLRMDGNVLGCHYFNPEHPRRYIYIVSPYLNRVADQQQFLRNPRKFLAGSDGFKMIDQPDLWVRRANLQLQREIQFDSQWRFQPPTGQRLVARKFADRSQLALAHMRVMRRRARVDFALWWGPKDRGSFGGYDFNWLSSLDPGNYTVADYLVRRREVETLTAVLSAKEMQEFYRRWISRGELLTHPTFKIEDVRIGEKYSVVLPMDLVVKLGTRRKTLSQVAPGPDVIPREVASHLVDAD